MRSIANALTSAAAGVALVLLSSAALSAAPIEKKELKPGELSRLEEKAESAADYAQLARLYQLRAEMLEEKVLRHERLEQRYAAAPASLLAKRGTAWNTPKRQRQLARSAAEQAQVARDMATSYLAKADSLSIAVD